MVSFAVVWLPSLGSLLQLVYVKACSRCSFTIPTTCKQFMAIESKNDIPWILTSCRATWQQVVLYRRQNAGVRRVRLTTERPERVKSRTVRSRMLAP